MKDLFLIYLADKLIFIALLQNRTMFLSCDRTRKERYHKRSEKAKFELSIKIRRPGWGALFFELAAAAARVAAAAIVIVVVSIAAAAAVAEQKNQNDDPPPVVVQAATDTVVVTHRNTSKNFVEL